jgi:hypothetical protein
LTGVYALGGGILGSIYSAIVWWRQRRARPSLDEVALAIEAIRQGQPQFAAESTYELFERPQPPTWRDRLSESIDWLIVRLIGWGGIAVMSLLFIGDLYWLWVAIHMGSFIMFVAGLMGPVAAITAPIGAYMLFFGVPQWIIAAFGP